MSVAVSYRLYSQNLARSLEITANKGPVKLASEHYLEKYASITSIEEFVSDRRLFRFAMEAFGLSDFADARGYMRKILEEGIADPRSLANRTTDQRIKEFARVFDFHSFGEDTMRRPGMGEAIVSKYVRQSMEETAGRDDGEGVRLALYFERMAPKVSYTYEILADPALSEVVRTVLGLPKAFGTADIDKQAAALEERLDIADLSDPEAIRRLLTQFTAIWDATEGASADPILSLFTAGTGAGPAISIDLAMSLQSLRLGGA